MCKYWFGGEATKQIKKWLYLESNLLLNAKTQSLFGKTRWRCFWDGKLNHRTNAIDLDSIWSVLLRVVSTGCREGRRSTKACDAWKDSPFPLTRGDKKKLQRKFPKIKFNEPGKEMIKITQLNRPQVRRPRFPTDAVESGKPSSVWNIYSFVTVAKKNLCRRIGTKAKRK